jgi:hypothetical protein
VGECNRALGDANDLVPVVLLLFLLLLLLLLLPTEQKDEGKRKRKDRLLANTGRGPGIRFDLIE